MTEAAQPIEIPAADLPLYCSGPHHETWNGHPRVFLPLRPDGSAKCPYCGTEYRITGEIKAHH